MMQTLVDQARQEIANAKANGHDVLAVMTDREIAEDIIEKTGDYEGQEDALALAIAEVRLNG